MLSCRFAIGGLIALIVAEWPANAQQTRQTPYLHAPSVTTYARHDPAGLTILPTGRYLKPAGTHFPVARWPHGLTLSPDGVTAFVASAGIGQLIRDWQTAHPVITAVSLAEAEAEEKKTKRTNTGAATFAPDGKTLYWSSGESGEIHVVDVVAHKLSAEISLNSKLNGRVFADSFAMDVKLSADGAYLYCADVTNFRVAVVDTRQKKVVGSVDVGRYPYALALQGTKVYVANIGMFAYSAIPPPDKEDGGKHDKRGLTFPAFGFPSKEAREGVEAEGRHVPGLGDPNVPESFSVWGVDIHDPSHPRVVSRIKTGLLVGAASDSGKTIGGSAPNFLAIDQNALWVSNGNNDRIERISRQTDKITQSIPIRPSPLVARWRGVGPSGMALSPDGRRLYVAESGLNALSVIDTRRGAVLGHIPTAWYPYRVAVSPDGKHLLCICFRGFGNGPNAGKNIPDSPFRALKGVLSVLDVPTDAQLQTMTQTCWRITELLTKARIALRLQAHSSPPRRERLPRRSSTWSSSPKKTTPTTPFFDHVTGANDDPTLLRWGYHQRIAANGQPTLADAPVMTNHNALARQFTVSDNFYMEPEASGVGHRWLIGVQPNNFCQMLYTLGWDFKLDSTAPGRRAAFGSNGSIAPEDYPEAGSMWEHRPGIISLSATMVRDSSSRALPKMRTSAEPERAKSSTSPCPKRFTTIRAANTPSST